jgi:catechol 2,3-dioxygenase-like lactoylglutathione lyase family enzyme
VFGETSDLEGAVDFWTGQGWTVALSLDLPVPPGKTALLGGPADQALLRYMTCRERPQLPGIEFVQHRPAPRPGASTPRLSIRLPGTPAFSSLDHDGNALEISGDTPAARIDILTPDIRRSRERLLTLGFVPSGEDGRVSLAAPFLPQRAVTVAWQRAPHLSEQPRIDEGGWNGLSFLVRDLDAVGTRVPLTARQSFSAGRGERREVAFYAGDGLLLEFLVVRQYAEGTLAE